MPVEATKVPDKPVQNLYKMNLRQWRKWPRSAKMAFNSTMDWLSKNQALVVHPQAVPITKKHWETIAHNAAFMAADVAAGRYWGGTGDKEMDLEKPDPNIAPMEPPKPAKTTKSKRAK